MDNVTITFTKAQADHLAALVDTAIKQLGIQGIIETAEIVKLFNEQMTNGEETNDSV